MKCVQKHGCLHSFNKYLVPSLLQVLLGNPRVNLKREKCIQCNGEDKSGSFKDSKNLQEKMRRKQAIDNILYYDAHNTTWYIMGTWLVNDGMISVDLYRNPVAYNKSHEDREHLFTTITTCICSGATKLHISRGLCPQGGLCEWSGWS